MVKDMPKLSTRWIFRIDQIKTCARCTGTMRPKGGREKIRRGAHTLCRELTMHEWGPLAGVIELKEMPIWQSDFRAFLSAKKLWEWENEGWLKKVGFI